MLLEQIIKQIYELLFNHIPDAARPNLFSIQILEGVSPRKILWGGGGEGAM